MNNEPATGVLRNVRNENHTVEITYWNIESKDNLDKLHGIVEKCSFLFPSWLKDLAIALYDSKSGEGSSPDAVCRPEKWEYGRAELDIYSAFWDRTERFQYFVIVHELIHIAQGKQLSVVRNDILPRVTENNKELGDHLEKQFREINEEFVETMTSAIVGLL